MSLTSNPNPLSNPKGVNFNCELCQKPAFFICKKCKSTYYCTIDHQKVDAEGIHDKICKLLIPIKAQVPFLPSHEERELYRKDILRQKMELLELTLNEGKTMLFERKYEKSIPAAMQCLKLSIDIYGQSSIELVTPYLILGEASVGIGHLNQGQEYLSQAQWTVLKMPGCSREIKSKLYRNIALLLIAKGCYEDATRELADDIYYSSEEFGPNHINTSGGFYHLADVFMRQGKKVIACSLFEQVSQIWYEYLKKIVDIRMTIPENPDDFGFEHASEINKENITLDSARTAEGFMVLQSIYDVRDRYKDEDRTDFVISCFNLAMLYYIIKNYNKSVEYAMRAGLMLSPDTPKQLTDDITSLLQHLRKTYPSCFLNI